MRLPLRTYLCISLLSCVMTAPCSAASASFDCSTATTTLEKLICETPSLAALDREMAAEYKIAISAPTADRLNIIADQRAWLRDRRLLCMPLVNGPNDTHQGPNPISDCVRDSYGQRIYDLSHPANRSTPDHGVCNAIAGAFKQAGNTPLQFNDPVIALSRIPGSGVEIAAQNGGSADLFHRNFHPDAGLKRDFEDFLADHSDAALTFQRLGASKIWGIEVSEGADDCESFLLFDATHKNSTGIDSAEGPYCSADSGSLFSIHGVPIFAEVASLEPDATGFSVSATPLSDDHKGAKCDVTATYSGIFSISGSACNPHVDCETLGALALSLSNQRALAPANESFFPDAGHVDRVPAQIAAFIQSTKPENLPDYSSDYGAPGNDYKSQLTNGVIFPVLIGTGTYVARLEGQPYLESPAYYLTIYSLDKTSTPTPVGAVSTAKSKWQLENVAIKNEP